MAPRIIVHNYFSTRDAEEAEWKILCNMKDPAAFTTAKWVSRTVTVRAATQPEAEAKAVAFYKRKGYQNIKVGGVTKS